jgi:hypothetical protein
MSWWIIVALLKRAQESTSHSPNLISIEGRRHHVSWGGGFWRNARQVPIGGREQVNRYGTLRGANDFVRSAAATSRVAVVTKALNGPVWQAHEGHGHKRVNPPHVVSDAKRLSGPVGRESAISCLFWVQPRGHSPAIHRARTGQLPNSRFQ